MALINNLNLQSENDSFHVGIIGGGIAGSTIALRLSELGIRVTLLEKGPSLVNGPPICHLHAGGNFYREISDQQCLTLLRQSIDTLKVYPHSANLRPTVFALPKYDKSTPNDLLPRLKLLKTEYETLIAKDISNEVLGSADEYYRFYSREQLEILAHKIDPITPECLDDWMIPVAKNIDFSQVQFPLLLVQEYGLSVFRLAATASLATDALTDCQVLTHTQVTSIKKSENKNGWTVSIDSKVTETKTIEVDYLVNACGFKTGEVDDMLNLKRVRMVEFKAAYIAHWNQYRGYWPEVIFYGDRGTPQGMAQLTPSTNGYFQLHGMTEDITLFKGGLVSSDDNSSQPQLSERFLKKIDSAWEEDSVRSRTEKSIDHIAQFLPSFKSAIVGGEPLFGAQQIPGIDPDNRVADISFSGNNYARTEIVKASSALDAADLIINKLIEKKFLDQNTLKCLKQQTTSHYFPVTQSLSLNSITEKAELLAKQRNYPTDIA
jgi:glycine/D-amino acid oxidase-like deaminating enzyme